MRTPYPILTPGLTEWQIICRAVHKRQWIDRLLAVLLLLLAVAIFGK